MIDSGVVQGFITIAFMASFIILFFSVFRSSKKDLYEERGRIPLDDVREKKFSSESKS